MGGPDTTATTGAGERGLPICAAYRVRRAVSNCILRDQIQPPRRERANGCFRFVLHTACAGLFRTATCRTRYDRHGGSVRTGACDLCCIPCVPGCFKLQLAVPDTTATTGACKGVLSICTAYCVRQDVSNCYLRNQI